MHDKVIAEKNISINKLFSDKQYYGLKYAELIEKDSYYKVIVYNSYNVSILNEESAVGYGRLLYDLKTSFGRDYDTVQKMSFRTLNEANSFYHNLSELDWEIVAGSFKKYLIKSLIRQGINEHTNHYNKALEIFNEYIKMSDIREFNTFDEVDKIREG